MAIPPNDMMIWNLLDSKPEDTDRVNPVYDIDANEQKCQTYAVLKSFFVKTDEPTDVEATVEFQSTSTKPNSILKFGSAGEFRIYSDGIDLFLKGTNATGKLRFYANSTEMFALNPVADSIATYGNVINNDGAAGEGLKFDSLNRAEFSKRVTFDALIYADAGIKLTLKNISFSGDPDTGLEYDVSNNATFKQILNCDSNLNVTGQINANKVGNYSINADGVIRTTNKFQWDTSTGITNSYLIVTDLRWAGATLEMYRRSFSIGGGIIYNVSTGSWVEVL